MVLKGKESNNTLVLIDYVCSEQTTDTSKIIIIELSVLNMKPTNIILTDTTQHINMSSNVVQ